MSEHARVAPSSMGVTVHCAGSVTMQEKYPQIETQDTREGTASHEAAAICLTTGAMPAIGDEASNGVIYTLEMIEAAQMLVDDVSETVLERGHQLRDGFFWVEQRVHMRKIHPTDNWGTCDLAVFFPDDMDLFIWDYKYGHLLIEARNNWQCLNYAQGFLELLETFGYKEEDLNIWINIVQPRGFHEDGPIRRWWFKGSKMGPYRKKMYDATQLALSQTSLVQNGEHCRYCTARAHCQAAQQAAYQATEFSYAANPRELPPEAIGTELSLLKRAAKLLEYRITGLEEVAANQIKQGKGITGWKLKPSKGRTKWNLPYADVVKLGQAMGHNLAKEELITPRQAILNGLTEDMIKPLTITPDRGVKLTQDDGEKAKSIFGKDPD